MTVTNEAPGQTESEVGRPNAFKRLHERLHSNRITGLFTKIVVTIIGVAVLGAGVIMMVTPGPGIVGIAVGLGILATEWAWADRWVQAAKKKAQEAADKAREMDPAVRRRRLLLAGVAILVVATAVLAYLAIFDWPGYAITGWNWVQNLHGAVPELPGM